MLVSENEEPSRVCCKLFKATLVQAIHITDLVIKKLDYFQFKVAWMMYGRQSQEQT